MKYLILAGGSGTRLWPLSRNRYPKQFLTLIGDKSMLQNTALRVTDNPDDIYIVTNAATANIIYNQLKEIFPEFDKTHIILEPVGRNTAPAIAYGCINFDENDVVAVLSADAHIADENAFKSVLQKAGNLSKQDFIVTLGITPTCAHTGYGYIKRSDVRKESGYVVDKFVEKPDLQTAMLYFASKQYFWNAGIFVFQVKTFFQELAKYNNGIYQTALKFKNMTNLTAEEYSQFENISIDYAVMEHSDKIAVIEANIGWNDIGSFKSLFDVLPKDENNNVCKNENADVLTINSENNYIYGKKQIVTLGVSNLVIADTEDALLISDMDSVQDIKKATTILKEQHSVLLDKFVTRYKEYGTCKILQQNNNHKVLELTIQPGHFVEPHYHKWCTNNVTVVQGQAEITIDEEKVILTETQSCNIKKNQVHKIANCGNQELVIIEVVTGPCDEEDMYYVKQE